MNKFEFDKTMECLGFDKNDSYKINGCEYYHDGRYFTIVKGKVPYELALLIRNKYDNNVYKIRVNGNHESEIPNGDIYTYHIDTIEGLVAFLIETQNYYSKSNNTSKSFEHLLSMVYSKILQDSDPNISICDWMLNNENRNSYFETILNMDTYLDFKLRKKIESFDNIVNPFCDNDLVLSDFKFIVRGNVYQDNSWFSLIDKYSGITMTTMRETGGFGVKLSVPADNIPYESSVYHYFNKNGEEIAFIKYDEFGLSKIEYNLSDSSFGKQDGIKHIATAKDKKFVIQSLDNYIALAKDVVKKNVDFNPKILKR